MSDSSHPIPLPPAQHATRRQMLKGTAAAGWLQAIGSPWPALVGASTLAASPLARAAAAAGIKTDRITVLYRPESDKAATRVDPTIQAATRALEREFLKAGLRVLQPSAAMYGLMDKGQSVIVTFAEVAGFSMVFQAHTEVRPVPGQEAGIAEVRLSSKVFVGAHLLSAEDGRGQMFARLDADVREAGIRRGLELAAQRAAADLAARTTTALRDVTPERLAELIPAAPTTAHAHVVVPLPTGGTSSLQTPAFAPPPPPPVPPAPAAAPAAAATPSAASPAQGAATPPAPGRPPAAPMKPSRNRFALVVGMSDYSGVRRRLGKDGEGIGDLKGVAKDFRLATTTLAEMGFVKERTAAYLNDECTSANVRGVLKQFAALVQEDDLVVVFFSAHGADKSGTYSRFGMPVLADFVPGSPDNLDFWELQSMLKNLKGRVVWINDTCHSGGAVLNMTTVEIGADGAKIVDNIKGPDALTVASSAAPGQQLAVLTACSPSEVSWEDAGGGLFTTRLFQEIARARGNAPLSQIFAERVYAPVVERSQQICRSRGGCKQQTPAMAVQGLGGNIVI